jgi:hypothetical protein
MPFYDSDYIDSGSDIEEEFEKENITPKAAYTTDLPENSNPLIIEVYRAIHEGGNLDQLLSDTNQEELQEYSGIQLNVDYGKQSELKKAYIMQLLYFIETFHSGEDGLGNTKVKLEWTDDGRGYGLYAKERLKGQTSIGVFGFLSKRKGITTFFPPLFSEKVDQISFNMYHSMDGTLSFINHGCGDEKNCAFYLLDPKSYQKIPGYRDFVQVFRLLAERSKIYSLRVIKTISKGKELLVNYGDKPANCQCSDCKMHSNML